jgi:hypothetical protein
MSHSTICALLFVGFGLVAQPRVALAQATDNDAYSKIRLEKKAETKRQLILAFEKTFPKSDHLAEAYIEMSRILVSQSNFQSAVDYAQKAVNAVAKLKSDAGTSGNSEPSWQLWVNTVETSARDNLNWTKQMMAWQVQQLRQRR